MMLGLRRLPFAFASVAVLSLVAAAGCSRADDGADDEASDLTSVTARSRDLEFQGKVYVDVSSSDAAIVSAVQKQAQTAFGPMRTSNIAVNSRELKAVDASTFVKRNVQVVDPSVANDPGTAMLEVTYTYKDTAVVALDLATRSTAALAVMMPGYQSQQQRILTECTSNDSEAQEFASQIWYVFDPSIASCKAAIKKEEDQIAADRRKLHDETLVAKSEASRLYMPITAKLGADKTNKGDSWPEYQRLLSGGVQPDKLVFSLLYGVIDDDHPNGLSGDTNWNELMANVSEIVDASGQGAGWKLVAGGPDAVDLSHFTLKSGKKVDGASIADLVHVHDGQNGLGLTDDEQADLDEQIANAIDQKWITIERPVTVKIGDAAPRAFAIDLLVYWGASSDSGPHKYAIKNSDVFLYNGHSYIGYGPLDPSNFTADDFPKSYQILWIDGCVSYNYYEKDYIPLKEGGTKNLDLVTNGIEAPTWHSGHAMAAFVNKMLGLATYKDLLVAAADTDPLRVVDGELDNDYTPQKFPIVISPR